MFPFKQISKKNKNLRIFEHKLPDDELVWHRDREDRSIISLNKTDWMIQYDNDLPHILSNEILHFIPKGVYHRLIKGSDDLELEVIKHS